MMEMTVDEKKTKVKEIRNELAEENICYKRRNMITDYNDLKAMSEVAKLIKDNKMVELQKLDVRNEVLQVVYSDCRINKENEDNKKKIRENFINEFDNRILKDNNVNLLIKTAFGKSYAAKNKLDYDYDDSLISSYIFCKTIDIPEPGEWHIGSISGYEYKIRKGEGFYLRGDTMTSWLTSLNKYLDLYGKRKFSEIPEKTDERIEYLCNPENYTVKGDEIYEAVIGFMEVVYTIGNFCPVPMNFNTARAKGNCDYWDLTLMKIREWYMDENEKHLKDLLHIKTECARNHQSRENCKKWLEWFGKGNDGWHNFVDTLYMQNFVYNEENSVVVVEEGRKVVKKDQNEKGNKEYYEVIPFWDGHEWDKENGAIKVKFPEKENEIKNAFETMTRMIRARSERIAKALVGVVDENN